MKEKPEELWILAGDWYFTEEAVVDLSPEWAARAPGNFIKDRNVKKDLITFLKALELSKKDEKLRLLPVFPLSGSNLKDAPWGGEDEYGKQSEDKDKKEKVPQHADYFLCSNHFRSICKGLVCPPPTQSGHNQFENGLVLLDHKAIALKGYTGDDPKRAVRSDHAAVGARFSTDP